MTDLTEEERIAANLAAIDAEMAPKRETLEPESYLGPKRYRITCRCTRCGKTYSWVTKKITDDNRPCKRLACVTAAMREEFEQQQKKLFAMIEAGQGPGLVGANVQVRAIDETAKIVMEDHKMTNLADNVRAGDSVAPKLPGHMQHAADGFFGGAAVAERNKLGNKQMELMGRRAIAGAYRGMALNPGNVVPGKKGEPILRSVGKG